MPTDFSNKCEILADLWLNYRDDEEFSDFVSYNDLGLPLAYAVANGIVESNTMIEGFVDEAFDLLLAGVGIEEDTGFFNLEEILDSESTTGLE
jgi:hypothetical protein